MRKFTVEDIENWENEAGETFFDDQCQLINTSFLLGFVLSHDKELFDLVLPMMNTKHGEALTVLHEWGEDGEKPNPEMLKRFMEAYIAVVNTSEEHNKRMEKTMKDYRL